MKSFAKVLKIKEITALLVAILFCFSASGINKITPYSFKISTESSIIAYSAVCSGAGFFLQSKMQPLSKLELPTTNSTLPRFDKFATKNYSSSIDKLSTTIDIGLALTCIGSVGVLSILQSDNKSFWYNSLTYAGLYAETIAVTFSTNVLIKNISKRKRPFVYNNNAPLNDKLEKDALHSFYSLHTAFATANTFFAASILSNFYEKKWPSLVTWGIAGTLPICIGAMRIEAGQHFLSDVVVGYLFGAACGYFVPRLHCTKELGNATVYVSPNSIVVKL